MADATRTSPAAADADIDEQIMIAAGRRAPFSQIGDWVTMAPISNLAYRLYGALCMHINTSRVDDDVWPIGEILAHFCQLTSDRHLKRARDELVSIGAIDTRIVRYGDGMRRRYVYTVHQAPPDGYDGYASTKDFYADRKAAVTAVRTVGTPTSPPVGTPTSPHNETKKNQKKKERDEDQIPSSSPPYVAEMEAPKPPRAGAQPEGEGGYESSHTSNAIALVRDVEHPWVLGKRTRTEAVALIAEHLAAGWNGPALMTHLTGNTNGIGNYGRVFISRLRDLDAPPSPRRDDAITCCPTHPGSTRRSSGECAGCWSDQINPDV